jgi:hypothetical protein
MIRVDMELFFKMWQGVYKFYQIYRREIFVTLIFGD